MIAIPINVSLPVSYYAQDATTSQSTIRAARFEDALKAYMATKGNHWSHNSSQCWFADMMADALHWCDANSVDVNFVLSLARSHHASEKLEDARQAAVSLGASHPGHSLVN